MVGAGPGDAGLLTLRGAELLRQADVVVYDALVNPELLALAPKEAEIIFGGRRAQEQTRTQPELNQLLIARARAGRRVVRLKGGDPYIFGRGGEEAVELAAAGVPFEVVPGVSALAAVPNYAGIPLTHRDHCSAFVAVTGHVDPGSADDKIDWAAVARVPGTKVIMMGTERVEGAARCLIAAGLSPETPAAMIQWGTTGRQRCVDGTLSNIAERARAAGIAPPTVIVVGEVVRLRSQINWFEHRLLFGKRIVVTRARDQAADMTRALQARGAAVISIPTISIGPPTQREPLVEALVGLGGYDWLVFTSSNGVTSFFEYFFRAHEDVRDLGNLRLAAVGAATAAKLRELHLTVDLVPEEYTAKSVVKAFADFESLENLRILLLRAEVANPDLPKALEERGAIVDDVACYRTVADKSDVSATLKDLEAHGADWITFTSGSTVTHFNQRVDLKKLLAKFPQTRLASIGPETSKALGELGFTPALEASPHTTDAMVAAIEAACQSPSR